MKGRDKLFFNLLTFLMIVVLGLVGYKNYEVDEQIKRWQDEMRRREERGMHDPQLKETVDKLEAELAARMEETFKLDPDPLDLTRVITAREFLKRIGLSEAAETDNRMRLSCTVLGGNSGSAIIKWRGKNHVLAVGDRIGDYRVASIGTNYANLRRGGELLKLKTEKAPDTKAAEEARRAKFQEPKVEVKHVSGNF